MSWASQFCGSRGSQSPRSRSRIFLPEGARWRASVPPPAPVPMMITSYVSMCSPPARATPGLDDSENVPVVHRPDGVKHPAVRLGMLGRTLREEVHVTAEQFEALFRTVSTWGKWGEDDERGALNRIPPERVAAAARLVREGITVTLSWPLNTTAAADNPRPRTTT